MQRMVAVDGHGTVVRQGPHVALMARSCGEATRRRVHQVLEDVGTGLVDAASHGQQEAVLEGATVVVASTTGPFVRLGGGITLVTDHVGYRSRRRGPAQVLLREPVALLVGIDSDVDLSTVGASVAGQRLREGARSAAAVAVDLGVSIGAARGPVHGVRCTCDAFVHPQVLTCARCARPVTSPRQTVTEPGLPVAWLTLDDGRRRALAGRLVIGRAPGLADAVAARAAAPLRLDDTERSVSRTHAELWVDGWTVWARNLEARNGTFLRPKGADDGLLLRGSDASPVLPGTAVRLGRRWLAIDA